MASEEFLNEKLTERKEVGLLRSLKSSETGIDFVSNDYLGLATHPELADRIKTRVSSLSLANGGTGSRLLAGNYALYEEVEAYLASLFQAEAALIFNSGYAANQGLVSAVAEKGDTILYDQWSHVCLKEGAWLSRASSMAFLHNDLADLEKKLRNAEGRKFVLTETVFSMDGDIAPIHDIIALCERHEAYLIVDEAHSTGTFGPGGSGWLIENDLSKSVFARVYTFGKGMGVHGACVVGSKVLKEYLVNFARTFIYTTSLPPHSVLSIEEAFRFLQDHPELRTHLRERIDAFKAIVDTSSETSVQPIIIPGIVQVRRVADELSQLGFRG